MRIAISLDRFLRHRLFSKTPLQCRIVGSGRPTQPNSGMTRLTRHKAYGNFSDLIRMVRRAYMKRGAAQVALGPPNGWLFSVSLICGWSPLTLTFLVDTLCTSFIAFTFGICSCVFRPKFRRLVDIYDCYVFHQTPVSQSESHIQSSVSISIARVNGSIILEELLIHLQIRNDPT